MSHVVFRKKRHAPALVPISVLLASGRELEVLLWPGDTVAELQERVLQEAGGDLGWLTEARVCSPEDHAPIPQHVPISELVARGVRAVTAVLQKSARKAAASLKSAEFTSVCADIRYLEHLFSSDPDACDDVMSTWQPLFAKYAPALELLIDQHVDFSEEAQSCDTYFLYCRSRCLARLEPGNQGVQECRRFAVTMELLASTKVRMGRRRLVHPYWFVVHALDRSESVHAEPEFCEAVVEEIRSPDFLDEFRGWLTRLRRQHEFQNALRWLAEGHPQPAVRAAALEVAARAGVPAAA